MAQGLHYLDVSAHRIARGQPSGPHEFRNLEPTMTNRDRSLIHLARILILGSAVLIFGTRPAHAQANLSGTYRCVSVEVAGKAHPCKAPSLEMNPDGSYQMLTEHGTYEILRGHWLVLSAAKNHGRARLVGGKQIIFEFVSGGKQSRIVYRRKYQRPPAWVSG